MDWQEFINRSRARAYGNSDPMAAQRARFTTRPPAIDPNSMQSVAGQVAPRVRREDLRPLPTRQEQEREYARLQQSPREAPAYQEPMNQFADAGQQGLEMTGLPSVRRSAAAFADNRPREGFEQGAMGALSLATLGVGGRSAMPGRPRAPMAEPQVGALRPPPPRPAGSVLPMREPEPFRNSMRGGSDDLMDAARAPDGSPSPNAPRAPTGRSPENALATARSWVESFGGGAEGERRAIGILTEELNQAQREAAMSSHPVAALIVRDTQAMLEAVQSGAYRQGERNSFSARVEAAFPELYRADGSPSPAGAQFRPDLGANDRGALQRGAAALRGDEFVDSASGQGTVSTAGRSVEQALAYSDSNALPTRGAFAAPAYVRSLADHIRRGDWARYSQVVDSVNEQGPLATVRVARLLAENGPPAWTARAADFETVNDLMRAQDFLEWVRRSNDPIFTRRSQILQNEARRDMRLDGPSGPVDPNAPARGPSQ